jgi:H+/gluconate symporter-like permease
MSTAIGLIGLLIAIGFLVYMAFKGHSIIVVAPIAALVALFFAYGMKGHFMATYTITYMEGFANYAKNYFPIYLLGAIFAKLMDISGNALSIAKFCTDKLGKERAVLSVVITCAVLTYGGVSLFVVAFVMLPVATALFREADVPKRLIPGCIALGAFTFTMTSLPGSPQVQNTIPMQYFGTDSFAAPGMGILASVIMFVLGMMWLTRRANKAKAAGEGYGVEEEVEDAMGGNLPGIAMAVIPILIILVVNLLLSKVVYPSVDGSYMEDYGTTLESYSGTWSVLLGMLVSIIFIIIVNFKKIKDKIKDGLKTSAIESLTPLVNSCAVVGFGSVVKVLPIFAVVSAAVLSMKALPLLSEVVSVNLLCAMTASASGGLSAALEVMGDTFLASGIDPQVLHRLASICSGGLDNLPYNGATVTVIALCGMTHKKSYLDMFMVATIVPIVASVVIMILGSMGLCF